MTVFEVTILSSFKGFVLNGIVTLNDLVVLLQNLSVLRAFAVKKNPYHP